MILEVGNAAPDFTLKTDAGTDLTLSTLRGKSVIIYFYPKDNTPGCTQEACDFRDYFPQLLQHGIHVLGISKDTVASHAKFKKQYALPFTLLTDPTATVCLAYGVMHPKSLFGKTFLSIQRSTFLINSQGEITAIWNKIKVPGHVKKILDTLG